MILRSLLFTALIGLTALPAMAQGTQIGFGETEHDSSAPVEITSDQLDVNQAAGKALFTGNVVVGQAAMRLTGDVVDVDYGENPLTGETEIRRVHATGNVTLVNGLEAAEGDEAVYTLQSGEVVMTGDVVLTQGDNAMAGDKLTVYLDAGTGFMEGRVKVIFNPAGDEKDGDPSKKNQ